MSTGSFNSDQLREIARRSRVQELVDHTAEGTLIAAGEVDVICVRCTKLVRVLRKIDDFGNAQIAGAARIRGRWVCSSCEFDEACDYAASLADEPFYDVPGPDWFPLSEAERDRMELDELADQGFLDASVVGAPDSWPVDRPEPISDADQAWYVLEASGAEIIGLGYSDASNPEAL